MARHVAGKGQQVSAHNMLMAAAGAIVAPVYTYATLNPADKMASVVLSNGNLTFSAPTYGGVRATQGKASGKWYFEFTVSARVWNSSGIGLSAASYSLATYGSPGWTGNSIGYMTNGQILDEGPVAQTNGPWYAGDVVGVAFDATARTVQFYLNGVAQGTAVSWTSAVEVFPTIGTTANDSLSGTANFGATPFAYPVPSGYNAGLYVDPSVGQVAYTTPGTHSWTVPAGVTSICVVCVGAGSGSSQNSGGGLAYGNNIAVTPGSTISLKVGLGGDPYAVDSGGDSWFISATSLQGGGGGGVTYKVGGSSTGTLRTGGGNGGSSAPAGYSGGGGAGGYSGNGGDGNGAAYASGSPGAGGGGGGGGGGAYGNGGSAGGGVGLFGEGSSGTGGSFPSGGSGGSGGAQGSNSNGYGGSSGGLYGGGAGSFGGGSSAGYGGKGAVRIIWGAGRSFPSTNTGDM